MTWADAFLYVGLGWAGVFLLAVLVWAGIAWRLVRRMQAEIAETDAAIAQLRRRAGR